MARKFNDALNLDFRDFRPDSGKRVVSSYWSKGKELCDFQSRCLQFLFERARGRKESGIWKLRSIEAVPGPERPDRLPVRPGGVLIV